jgi:ABC-type multidrug transport system ATPase subunit
MGVAYRTLVRISGIFVECEINLETRGSCGMLAGSMTSTPASVPPPTAIVPAVSAINLGKKYGKYPVLEGVNFNVLPGQVYALAGPNGAGKTTLIRLITGLSFPTSGKVLLNGEDVHTGGPRVRRFMGAVVEAPAAFYPHLSGRENLEAHARLAGGVGLGNDGVPFKLDDNRIREVLTLTELLRMQDRKVGEYSLGQRQRLGLAGAILANPKVLILDEPTSGLDPLGIDWFDSPYSLEHGIQWHSNHPKHTSFARSLELRP